MTKWNGARSLPGLCGQKVRRRSYSIWVNSLPSQTMSVFNLLVWKALPGYCLNMQAQSKIVESKELSNRDYCYALFTLALLTIVTTASALQPRRSENARRCFKVFQTLENSSVTLQLLNRWIERQTNERIRNPRKCSHHKPSHLKIPLVTFAVPVV